MDYNTIYVTLSLEHCLSAKGASLREAAKISVCRKTVGMNMFLEDIELSLRLSPTLCLSPLSRLPLLTYISFLYSVIHSYGFKQYLSAAKNSPS